jgi:hypothetical protein
MVQDEGLQAYALAVQPDAAWPGLAGSGQLRLQQDVVARLAGELKAKAAAVEGLPGRLAAATGSVRYGPSTWHEAANLADASGQVHAAVDTYVKGLLGDLAEAGQLMDTSHSNYGEAEDANTTTARRTDAEIAGTPVAGAASAGVAAAAGAGKSAAGKGSGGGGSTGGWGDGSPEPTQVL